MGADGDGAVSLAAAADPLRQGPAGDALRAAEGVLALHQVIQEQQVALTQVRQQVARMQRQRLAEQANTVFLLRRALEVLDGVDGGAWLETQGRVHLADRAQWRMAVELFLETCEANVRPSAFQKMVLSSTEAARAADALAGLVAGAVGFGSAEGEQGERGSVWWAAVLEEMESWTLDGVRVPGTRVVRHF